MIKRNLFGYYYDTKLIFLNLTRILKIHRIQHLRCEDLLLFSVF